MFDIIITTYNKPRELRLSLDGFTRQTRTDFKVHVVNDGGDCVESIVGQFSHKLDIDYHFFGPVTSEFRLAAARNVGLRHCQGERVLVHDGDVVPGPDLVAIHAGYGDQLAIVGSNRIGVDYADWRDLDDTTNIAAFAQGVRIVAPGRQCIWEIVCLPKWDAERNFSIDPYRDAWGPSISVPTQPVKTIGGYWEEFVGWGGEDAELAMRLGRMGCRTLIRPDALVYHLDHTTCEPQTPTDRAIMQERVDRLFRASLNNKSLVRNERSEILGAVQDGTPSRAS